MYGTVLMSVCDLVAGVTDSGKPILTVLKKLNKINKIVKKKTFVLK